MNGSRMITRRMNTLLKKKKKKSFSSERLVLRFESVHYYAQVWLNGKQVSSHVGGHLPFEADITNVVSFSVKNRLVVAVNNTLSPITLPPGEIVTYNNPNYPANYTIQNTYFDFFNYGETRYHSFFQLNKQTKKSWNSSTSLYLHNSLRILAR